MVRVNNSLIVFILNHPIIFIGIILIVFYIPTIFKMYYEGRAVEYTEKVLLSVNADKFDYDSFDKALECHYRRNRAKFLVGMIGVIIVILSIIMSLIVTVTFRNFDPLKDIVVIIKSGKTSGSNLDNLEKLLNTKGEMVDFINWTSIVSQILLTSIVITDIFGMNSSYKDIPENLMKYSNMHNEFISKKILIDKESNTSNQVDQKDKEKNKVTNSMKINNQKRKTKKGRKKKK